MHPAGYKILPVAVFLLISQFFTPQPSKGEEASELIISHSISVRLDLDKRSISGSDRIEFRKASTRMRLIIRPGSSIEGIEADGVKIPYSLKEIPSEKINEVLITLPSPEKDGPDTGYLDIRFHGNFQSIRDAKDNIRRGVAFVDDGVMGPEGAFLPASASWYPLEDSGLPLFDVTVTLPEGFTSVMEGELVRSYKKDGSVVEEWRSDKPLEGINLVAGRYHVEKETYKGISIYTYLFEKDDSLSGLYIEKTKGYLDLYQGMIGPYPFRKFAVVENFLPTGYGMPSYTLLGSTVIKLPFIPDTSLGHEIAHNWWGNSVFIDSSLGNWSEAITTYTADYLYSKRAGSKESREFRIGKLRGYRNFAGNSKLALKDFKDSTTPESRAVGYNKGVMVFNMLDRLLGEEKFKKGLKEFYRSSAFRRANWNDIKSAFEKTSGEDLGWFFDEWIKRPGGPRLSLEDVKLEKKDKGYLVTFTVKDSEAYMLGLPVLFKTEGGDVWKEMRVNKEKEELSVELSSLPLSLEIDPEYQVFRILSDVEVPPSFAAFLGDKNGVIVLPNRSRVQEKYFGAAETFSKDYNLAILTDADAGRKDFPRDRSLLIFGGPGENMLYNMTEGYLSEYLDFTGDTVSVGEKSYKRAGAVLALAARNPYNPAKVLCLFTGEADKDAITGAAKRLRYFSESSYIVFKKEGQPDKGTFEGRKVLRYEFSFKAGKK